MNNLPSKAAEEILTVAKELVEIATTKLIDKNVLFPLGALSVALANVAAMANVSHKDLIYMVEQHYEKALLAEVKYDNKELNIMSKAEGIN